MIFSASDQLILHDVFGLHLAAATGRWAGRRGRPGLDVIGPLQSRDGVIFGSLRALPERLASLSRLVQNERSLGRE